MHTSTAAVSAVSERQLAALYRIVSELFLHPEQRSDQRISAGLQTLRDAPAPLKEPLEAFLAEPRAADLDEYVSVLELSPPCPLYLGSYIFDEPSSCLGAGLSGRNGYMLELAATYRHFGFEMAKNELADFVPAMSEFLAISLERPDRDRIGVRRRFVEKYFRPGLKPMREALAKVESPYRFLLSVLEAAVEADRMLRADDPMWMPPKRAGRPPAAPVISYNGQPVPDAVEDGTVAAGG